MGRQPRHRLGPPDSDASGGTSTGIRRISRHTEESPLRVAALLGHARGADTARRGAPSPAETAPDVARTPRRRGEETRADSLWMAPARDRGADRPLHRAPAA